MDFTPTVAKHYAELGQAFPLTLPRASRVSGDPYTCPCGTDLIDNPHDEESSAICPDCHLNECDECGEACAVCGESVPKGELVEADLDMNVCSDCNAGCDSCHSRIGCRCDDVYDAWHERD
jgi:hypothetical protein